jgi:hypothetical protein
LATCLLTDDTFETLPSELIHNIVLHHTNTHPAISHAMNVVACIKILMGNISRNLQQERYTFYGITGRDRVDEVSAAIQIQSMMRGGRARAKLIGLAQTVNTELSRQGQGTVTHEALMAAIKENLVNVDFSKLH